MRSTSGRGLTRFSFTYRDIAALVGLRPEVVRKLARPRKTPAGSHPAAFDPRDLGSVVAFVIERSDEHRTAVAEAVLAAGGDMSKAAAALGVSRSTLYRRARSSPR